LKFAPAAKLCFVSRWLAQAPLSKQTDYAFRRGKEMLQKRLFYVFSHKPRYLPSEYGSEFADWFSHISPGCPERRLHAGRGAGNESVLPAKMRSVKKRR
jgi:hypothetical protein